MTYEELLSDSKLAHNLIAIALRKIDNNATVYTFHFESFFVVVGLLGNEKPPKPYISFKGVKAESHAILTHLDLLIVENSTL